MKILLIIMKRLRDNEIFISFLFFFFRDCDPVILNNLLSRLINTLRVYKYKFPFLNLRIKLYLSFNSIEKYCFVFFFFGE